MIEATHPPQAMPGAATAELCPAHLRKRRLRRREAVEYLEAVHGYPVVEATLAKYATVGGGPMFQKAGRWPLYEPAELDRWALSRLGPVVRSTAT